MFVSFRSTFIMSMMSVLLFFVSSHVSAQPAPAPQDYVKRTVKTPDGVSLSVQEWGNPNGPAILFVHGFAQSHLAWTKQVKSDLSKNFRMITFDIRGHGQSDKPTDPAAYKTARLWADEIKAIIEQTNLQRPVLVGWSYGGRLVLDYLSVYGDAGIAGIELAGSGSGAPRPEVGRVLGGMFSDDLSTNINSTRAFLRMCYQKQPGEGDFETVVGYNMLAPLYVRKAMFPRTESYDQTLRTLKAPVLITNGEDDQIVSADSARARLALIPQAKGSFYPGVGHSTFWEDPERFNRELSEFVNAANRR